MGHVHQRPPPATQNPFEPLTRQQQFDLYAREEAEREVRGWWTGHYQPRPFVYEPGLTWAVWQHRRWRQGR